MKGSGYLASKEHGIDRLPRTLHEATDRLDKSSIARELLGINHFYILYCECLKII